MFPKDGMTPIDAFAFVGTEVTDVQESQAVKAPVGLATIIERFVIVMPQNRIEINATALFMALSPTLTCVALRIKGFLSTFLDPWLVKIS